MKLSNVIYKKEFISQTNQKDVSYHGSPIYEDFQNLNEKDEKIRKDLINNYSLGLDKGYNNGFDGTFFYKFQIREGIMDSEKDKTKNQKYTTSVHIERTASPLVRDYELADIESFLRQNGFEKIK